MIAAWDDSPCPECNGAGVVGAPRREGPPTRPRTVQDICPTCDGTEKLDTYDADMDYEEPGFGLPVSPRNDVV
jgi:DnaJ-class molecular chaperone